MVQPLYGKNGYFLLDESVFADLLQSETPVDDLLEHRSMNKLKVISQILSQVYRDNDTPKFNNVDSNFSRFLDEKDTDANQRAVTALYKNNTIKPLVDKFLRYSSRDRVHFIDRFIVYGLVDLYNLLEPYERPKNLANKPAYYNASRRLQANSMVGERGAAFKAAVNKFLMTLYVYSLYFKEEDPNKDAKAQEELLKIMGKLGGRRTRRQRK